MIIVTTPKKSWQKVQVFHFTDGSMEDHLRAYEMVLGIDGSARIALTDIENVKNWILNNVDRVGLRKWFVRYDVTTMRKES